jgi:hypothetical protein
LRRVSLPRQVKLSKDTIFSTFPGKHRADAKKWCVFDVVTVGGATTDKLVSGHASALKAGLRALHHHQAQVST